MSCSEARRHKPQCEAGAPAQPSRCARYIMICGLACAVPVVTQELETYTAYHATDTSTQFGATSHQVVVVDGKPKQPHGNPSKVQGQGLRGLYNYWGRTGPR